MEQWIEVNLMAGPKDQDRLLLETLRPYVWRLKRTGNLISWHYFREPEVRFRLRLKNKRSKLKETRVVASMADSLRRRGLVTEWHFGSHGEKGRVYSGEEDRYGKEGWKAAQEYFNHGSETALKLLDLKRNSRLENPLWGKGLGNPWEGGEKNPWRMKEEDPLAFHWSRYVHLFSNQLGFDMEREAEFCSKQSQRYRQVMKEFGMSW
ncbi:MAG: thiopeptide-type bacteriocin biosynthesis protein [Thaumarchaeota archaeon]|nr:thiopeptide-type bacteriocin biosynthesis protein [Nitrososphaerota archaeon]